MHVILRGVFQSLKEVAKLLLTHTLLEDVAISSLVIPPFVKWQLLRFFMY